jgi:hypothetical protein
MKSSQCLKLNSAVENVRLESNNGCCGASRPISPSSPGDRAASARQRRDVLPISLPPRGLSRLEAAAYVGTSPSLFDQMVSDGRMPNPVRINRRSIWDRYLLDRAFDVLLGEIDETMEDWTAAA